MVLAADAHGKLGRRGRPDLEVDDPIARNGAEHAADVTGVLSARNPILKTCGSTNTLEN
jgi:hypothetical protein